MESLTETNSSCYRILFLLFLYGMRLVGTLRFVLVKMKWCRSKCNLRSLLCCFVFRKNEFLSSTLTKACSIPNHKRIATLNITMILKSRTILGEHNNFIIVKRFSVVTKSKKLFGVLLFVASITSRKMILCTRIKSHFEGASPGRF
jgi:hypothetical protein